MHVSDPTIERTETARFERETQSLIKQAEDHRLLFMSAYRDREMVAGAVGIGAVFLFGSGFGYFLFIEAQLLKALACIVLAFAIPIFLQIWSRGPVSAYVRDYKTTFMPQMAKALGGFRFYPKRGIGAKFLPKTGVIPAHDSYQAEDCFIGVYKGIKVLLSEARLSRKGKNVFDGVFVLLEIPNSPIEGHTIITCDSDLIAKNDGRRWQSLSRVPITLSTSAYDRFSVYSNAPETAKMLAGEKLLKELSEAADVFDKAPLSAVFFGKKYVFLSIPYAPDMFEASSIYVPVSSPDHAMTCKREIEQILEIIDVFDIYQNRQV